MPNSYCWYCNQRHPQFSRMDENWSAHRFKYGRARASRKQLDIWQLPYGAKVAISEMTHAQLTQAIVQIKSGWKCFGQVSKIISLEKALARLENA